MPRSHAAEAMPQPQEEPKKAAEEKEIEVTSDMIVEDSEDAFEVKESLEVEEKEKKAQRKKDMTELRKKLKRSKDPSDDTAEALEGLRRIGQEREMEKAEAEGRAEAERLAQDAAAERAALLAERDKKSSEALRKKMETDKRKEDMDALRGKLAGIKEEREYQAFEAAVAEEGPKNPVESKVREAEFLGVPGFDAEGYKKALYAVSNLEDEMANSGFLKKLTLRGKLKRAKAGLKTYEDQIDEAKAEMNVERARRDAGTEPLSSDERKRRDEVKRKSSRWGMSGGPKY